MFWWDQGGMFVLTPTPLQLEEDLEQLKVLENGYKIKVLKCGFLTYRCENGKWSDCWYIYLLLGCR